MSSTKSVLPSCLSDINISSSVKTLRGKVVANVKPKRSPPIWPFVKWPCMNSRTAASVSVTLNFCATASPLSSLIYRWQAHTNHIVLCYSDMHMSIASNINSLCKIQENLLFIDRSDVIKMHSYLLHLIFVHPSNTLSSSWQPQSSVNQNEKNWQSKFLLCPEQPSH